MEENFPPEYVSVLRRMTGEQKLKAVSALYWSARRLKEAFLREQHPEWTDDEVRQKVKEIFLHART